jgi:hypothetical protein
MADPMPRRMLRRQVADKSPMPLLPRHVTRALRRTVHLILEARADRRRPGQQQAARRVLLLLKARSMRAILRLPMTVTCVADGVSKQYRFVVHG